jgi:diaminohydroxyphosphoribosylaminopyrimidine deaminase/5-amino-6-(5-phosphoribosylamino)uracil reductase
MMVEGGPSLASSFLDAGLVDRWLQYQAPVILGAGPRWPDRRGGRPDRSFSLTRVQQVGPDLLAVHDRRRFQAMLEQVTI